MSPGGVDQLSLGGQGVARLLSQVTCVVSSSQNERPVSLRIYYQRVLPDKFMAEVTSMAEGTTNPRCECLCQSCLLKLQTSTIRYKQLQAVIKRFPSMFKIKRQL